MLQRLRLHAPLVAAIAAVLFGAAPASAVTLASTPAELARAALGEQPGSVVVGLWQSGQARYAGLRDGAAMPPQLVQGEGALLYEIGSISKVFTGLLLAQAVEAGDLSLEDTLGKLLAGKARFAAPEVATITLRQLVTHTSCLPRLPADFDVHGDSKDPYRGYDRQRMWAALAKQALPASPPCDPAYSNFGMAVVGELLSERYGKPWAVLVRERITAPLGMEDTVQTLGAKAARLAPGFSGVTAAQPWEFDAFAGAGALRSTPRDLLLFGRAILAGRNGPLGVAAERLVQPLGRFDGEIGYAMFVRGPAGKRSYMHNGGTGGYRSLLLLDVPSGTVLAVMAANAAAPVDRMTGEVLAALYPVQPVEYAIGKARLADYAGVYRENSVSALSVVAQDGVLYARGVGQQFRPLTPSGPDGFTGGTISRVDFLREGGRISGARWSSLGADRTGALTRQEPPALALLPQEQVQAYAGRYRAANGLHFDVKAAEGQLTVQLDGQQRFAVYPVPGQADRFAWDIVAAQVQFERHLGGAVRSLVLHQNGRLRAEKLD